MRKSILYRFYGTLLPIAFGVFSVFVASAQNSRVLVKPDGEKISTPLKKDAHLKTLITDLHPSVYLENGAVKVRDKRLNTDPSKADDRRPVVLFTDFSSFELIQSPTFPVGAIEVVTIRLDDAAQLGSKVDMAVFENYGSLKYVHLIASFKCDLEALRKMLENVNGKYSVLLTVEEAS